MTPAEGVNRVRRKFLQPLRGMRRLLLPLAAAFALLAVTGCDGGGALRRPNLVCAGQDGKTLVLYDSRLREILLADRAFHLLRRIPHPDFSNLWGMDADRDRIVVANQRTLGYSRNPAEKKALAVAELIFFDFEGRETKRLAWTGETGPIVDPRAVLLMRDGTLLVSDIRLNRLVRLDAGGNLLATIGTYGFGPGQFFYPNDLQETPAGNVLVVDSFNCRLQELTPAGAVVRVVGGKGSADGRFLFPQHVAADAAGNWYVTELANRRISVFDREFRFLRVMRPEPLPKFPQLYDIRVVEDPETILVADSRNGSLHVLSPAGRLERSVTGLTP